jgi:Right handed beta helix region
MNGCARRLSGTGLLVALLAFATPPLGATTTVPLGTASGGIGVYYNDNGGGENALNAAYVRAQFSYSNTNGSEFNFDSTPLAGTGGAVSFYSLFQAVPNQFGLDLVLKAPSWDGSVALPVVTAKDNVNNTLAGATSAGPVTWAISGYTGSTDGPANPLNAIINSVFRGGTGANDGVVLTVQSISHVGTVYTQHIEGEFHTDGLVHWYTPSTPDGPVGNIQLTGTFFFVGDVSYDSAGDPGTDLIDFYAGSVSLSAEVVCGARYVNTATGQDFFPGPTPNYCRNLVAPCKTIQRTVDLSCPGDVVNVAAGTYPEQVTIPKALTVHGAGKTLTIIRPTSVAANTTSLSSGNPIAPIVLVTGAGPVAIDNLKVDGSGAAFNACSPGYMGVYYRNASGALDNVHVTSVVHPSALGCQSVVGILAQSGGAGSTNLAITASMIDNYGKNGITCNEAATTCNISGTTVTGRGPVGLGDAAQNGIQLGFGASGSVVGCEAHDNNYTPATDCATGILLAGVDGVLVQGNTVDGNLCDILVEGDGNTLDGNVVQPAGLFPFSILGNGNDSTRNVVDGSGSDGVYVDGTGNTFTCNRIVNSAGAGFFFDSSFAGGTGSGVGAPNDVHSNSITGNAVGLDAGALDPGGPSIAASGNWWGCVAGPGNPGCDTVTGNAGATPVAPAPPTCVNCSADAQCTDGLACNGAETCNLGTNVCQPGTAVVCPAPTQCEASVTCQEPSGGCLATPKPNDTICNDGQVCTVGDTCQGGVCTGGPGGDADNDGDCDLAEAACGCNGSDANEVCILPNRLVGRGGNLAGEVIMNWNTPTVRRVPVATDPSCATLGECTAGRCTGGRIYDLCTTDADCNLPADTCRVIINWADTADLALTYARIRRTAVGGFTPVTPGCSRKVNVALDPTRRITRLKLLASGTIDLRLRKDRDVIQFVR